SIGYTFVHLGSWYQYTNRNRFADINLHRIMISEFNMVLLKKTILYPVSCKLGIFGDAMHHAKISLNQFEKIKTIPKISLPTYSFIHFLLPHAPYSFDRNGKILPDVHDRDPERKERYIEQLIFTNKKILETVDSLIIYSEIKPIIILQADEGPFPKRAVHDFLGFDWKQANDGELRQKTGILNAYLFPGINDSVFYESITPVNSFRLLFNAYFKAGLSLFPDTVFIISNEKFPYDYINITDRVINVNKGH
ncbi:MAG: hypothetical protein PVI26_14930, partial [Chitinispirillia bacterium]